MSKFKIGDPVTFKDKHKKNSWYITDVLYVKQIFTPHEYEKQFTHELLELSDTTNKEHRVVHESKVELNLSELKLNELGI